jgi:hypothetical protein
VVFRATRGTEEMRAHLALRFRAYRVRGRTVHLLPDESAGLDLDPYDAVSRHLGLFLRTLNGETLAGTLRVSGTEACPELAAIEDLLRTAPDLEDRFREPRRYPLPMMKYLIDREAVARLAERIEEGGETIVEPGRLAVAPELSDVLRRAARHLAPHIIESAVAFFFFFFDYRHAALTCDPTHVRFYSTVGFADAPGTERRRHPEFDAVVVCLYARRDDVPEPARSRVLALAARIRREGGACRSSTFPDCLGGPYETGTFTASDLLCPAVARALLVGER